MKATIETHNTTLSGTLVKGAVLGVFSACIWFTGKKALHLARASQSLSQDLSDSLDEQWHWMPG